MTLEEPDTMTNQSKPRASAWQWFPQALFLSMAAVFAVNGVLIWQALESFPGKAVENDFDASNNYNQVLEAAHAQAVLGWKIDARAEAGRPVIVLVDRTGRPLEGATITATARRPLGPTETTHPTFMAEQGGIYRAQDGLTLPGNWDLMLRIETCGHAFSATRRVIVK